MSNDYKLDDSVVLIGLVGHAGSGKDTFAQIVRALFENATKEEAFDWVVSSESFAAPIKSMVAMLLDFFGVASIMNRDAMNEYLDGSYKEEVIDTIGMSPRQLQQTLGTEWGRNIVNENLWLNSMAQRLPQYNEAKKHGHKGAVVLVTDVRFDNEAHVIQQLGGKLVYITHGDRVLEHNSKHVSEQGISAEYIDMIIDNSGTIDDYITNVRALMEDLLAFKFDDRTEAEPPAIASIASEEIVGNPTIIQGKPKQEK